MERLQHVLSITPSEALTPEPFEFRVYGQPAPQGSKKVLRYIYPDGKPRAVIGEACDDLAAWRREVIHASKEQLRNRIELLPLLSPVNVSIDFIFPRPASHYGTGKNTGILKKGSPSFDTNTRHGDLDKLVRAVGDALSTTCGGIVLRDDNLIVLLSARKRYTEPCESPGALIKASLA